MASDMDYPAERGFGWIAFAGIMLMISGSISFIQGLWAIDHGNNAQTLQNATQLSYSDLETWGWIVLIWGSLVFFAGIGVFMGSRWARWVGIIMASISLLLSFFWVFAFPIAAFTVMFVDLLVLYALFAYGGRDTADV